MRLSAVLLPLAFPSIGECEVDLKMQQIVLFFFFVVVLQVRVDFVVLCFVGCDGQK